MLKQFTFNGLHVRPLFLLLRTLLVSPHSTLISSPKSTIDESPQSPSTKVPSSKPTTKNPSPTIQFMKNIGLHNTHIEKIITLHPTLLKTNVDKTLEPRLRVLESLGLHGSDLVNAIIAVPEILIRGLGSNSRVLVSKLEFLGSVLGGGENVVSAVKRVKWLMSSSLGDKLKPNVMLLRSYGIPDEKIKRFLVSNPRCLVCKPEWIEASLVRVEEVLGIPRKSAMFIHGFSAMVSLGERNLKSKFELFKKYGWSEAELLLMAKQAPFCLKISEAKLKTGVSFFIEEIGFGNSYLARHPNLLMYSMEKRIRPRYEVLQVLNEKELVRNPSLYTVMSLAESRFRDVYVLPYQDELPEMYDAYMSKQMGRLAG